MAARCMLKACCMRLSIAALLSLGLFGCEEDLLENYDAKTTVSWRACVREDFTDIPLKDVLYSIVDRPELPTAMTDASGCVDYAGLPRNERLVMAWSKDGYNTRSRTIDTGTNDFEWGYGPSHKEYLINNNVHPRVESWSGIAIDWSKPILSVFVRETGRGDAFLPDVTVTVSGAPPNECYYPSDWLQKHLDSAGCGTAAANTGVARVYNETPGTVEVTLTSSDGRPLDCVPSGVDWHVAWPTGVANTFSVPLRDGMETYMSADCRR